MNDVSFIAPRLERFDELAPGGVITLFRFEERLPLQGAAGLIDWRLHGHLSRLAIDGFVSGASGEALLVPLRGRLPFDHLVMLGLGPPERFDEAAFDQAISRMFEVQTRLRHEGSVVALPGRPELRLEPAEAIARFLAVHERRGWRHHVRIVEPSAAQKAMTPVLERWRLKRTVPLPA